MQNKQNQSNAFTSIVQKIKLSIKDFFSKCEQIDTKLWICSHLPKKSLMERFLFCAVKKERSEMEDEEKILHFKLLDIRE